MSVSKEIDYRETTSEGTIEKGVVNFGNNTVRFEDRKPHNQTSEEPFLLETGLAAGIESLSFAARKINELGYRAISIGHTHHDTIHPIRHNAEDIEAVAEVLTGDQKVHSAGLSRGWPAQVLATKHMPEKVVSLTAIAPAMMAPVNPLRITMLGLEVVRETVRSPSDFGRVLIDCVNTVKERPDVTASEALKLIFGHVHKRVLELKDTQDNLSLHLVSSVRDGFFDETRLEAVAKLLGFDTYRTHVDGTAGHAAFTYSSELVASIVNTAITFKKSQPFSLQ